MLTILIIVLLVLLLTGGIGFRRHGHPKDRKSHVPSN
jgi:hypothetical protein